MVRVLHVVSNISIRSGIMSVLMNYFRNIDREILEFDFLFYDERPDTYLEEIEKLGGITYKILRPSNPINFNRALDSFFREQFKVYPVVHIHDVFLSGFFARFRRSGDIQKIIVHSHATKYSEYKIRAVRNKILSIPNYFVPDYYFACSSFAGKKIFGYKFKKEGQVINNAINLGEFYPEQEFSMQIKRMLGLEGKYVIGHVGNFTPQKNHFFLVKVFKRILELKDDAVLVLIGDGRFKDDVIKKCGQLGIINNVLYLGIRSDVNQLMRAFDCFLFPSKYEGLGVVLIEAQATGIPCVFSDVVPLDANILKDSNQIISLKAPIDKWAKAAINCPAVDIRVVHQKIEDAGYNIATESKKLETLYLHIVSS